MATDTHASKDAVRFALQMLNAPGAPTFPTPRAKFLAVNHLARQIDASRRPTFHKPDDD